MREVFENLAEQAMVHVPGQTGLHTRAFSLEKFAELIVKECAKIAAEQSAIKPEYRIRRHFGVEE